MGKKRLGDLYRTHSLVECDDGSGETVAVSLVKINRSDTDSAVVAANAIRARVLMNRHDPTSDLWLEAYGDILDNDRESLVRTLIADDLAQKRLSAEAEEAAQERWSEDEYLDGLRTLWTDELMLTWASNQDDPDAKRVYAELSAFRDAVNARLAGEEEDLAEAYSHIDLEELRHKVVAKLIDNTASSAWVHEFELQRLYYATRDALNRSKRYFGSIDEIRDLDDRIYTQLRVKYDALATDVTSGKASPATQGSSPPSEPSAEEEGSPPSGPEVSTTSKTSPTSS